MDVLIAILLVLAIAVLFLIAVLLIKILFPYSENTEYKKTDFEIKIEQSEQTQIKREEELEERRNWKPDRSRVFIPSIASDNDGI